MVQGAGTIGSSPLPILGSGRGWDLVLTVNQRKPGSIPGLPTNLITVCNLVFLSFTGVDRYICIHKCILGPGHPERPDPSKKGQVPISVKQGT